MSSDDSSDSGDSGFDKEAEREKLREKYEDDEQDRENTRRMSELLLQGATMTGKHCGECGDPIFRYDGQEFCPTCQREVEGGAAQQGTAQQGTDQQGAVQQGTAQDQPSAESAQQSAQGSGTAEPNAEERNQTAESAGGPSTGSAGGQSGASDNGQPGASDDEPRVEINDVRVADEHADASNVRRPPSQQGESADRSQRTADRGDEGRRTRRHGHDRSRQHAHDHTQPSGHASGRAEDDLGAARDALTRKLADLARRAEETDDVARARDLLAATREAAEALDALDRVNR